MIPKKTVEHLAMLRFEHYRLRFNRSANMETWENQTPEVKREEIDDMEKVLLVYEELRKPVNTEARLVDIQQSINEMAGSLWTVRSFITGERGK